MAAPQALMELRVAAAGAFGTGTGPNLPISRGGDIEPTVPRPVYRSARTRAQAQFPTFSGLSPEVIQELFGKGDFLANGGDPAFYCIKLGREWQISRSY